MADLALFYEEEKKQFKALEMYSRANQIEPKEKDYWKSIAELYQRTNNF